MLYLHESIDILGAGQDAYVQSVLERAAHSEAAGISRLVGVFKVIGSTHRWPRVVNLWEMDGWGHWAATLERQFLPERTDPALAPWWARTAQWRSGGFDRILEPASFSPTRGQIETDELSGWVCSQTISRAHPGRTSAVLDAIHAAGEPLGHQQLRLVGAWTVPMRSDEIVEIWIAPTFATLCAWYEARGGDPRWQVENRRRSEFVLESETLWMVPAAGCVLASSRAVAS